MYLGAERFNARDEGAQLTMAEVGVACAIAHAHGARIYLTLNILLKDAELRDALRHLGEAIDLGVDAAIVQDLGLIRLIRRVYPGFEVHGSTQLTVHDVTGARFMRELGIERVVLARENTLADIRAIREAVEGIGLEAFVHGALCISYSGQCLMSGMISERSANRGSCAQACRKDYVLTDTSDNAELDRGYLISARDLAAHDQLAGLAEVGISTLKVEGRKKKPEYVATVTQSYRQWLDRLASGNEQLPAFEEVRPLVQIYSRGFTAGMLVGRAGRSYITREQPDNRGHEVGVVVRSEPHRVIVEVSHPIVERDGLGFDPPAGKAGKSMGFAVQHVETLGTAGDRVRQAVVTRDAVPVGWRVFRNGEAALLERARASYASLPAKVRERKMPVSVRLFGAAGSPLKSLWAWDDQVVEVRSEVPLAPATKHGLDAARVREQLSRLGETPFVLADLDLQGVGAGLFIPVSELNALRTRAVDELMQRRDWAQGALAAERAEAIERAVSTVEATTLGPESSSGHKGTATTLGPESSAGHKGTATTLDPESSSGHYGTATTLCPESSSGHYGTAKTLGPESSSGHYGTAKTLGPESSSGHKGTATTLDPESSSGHYGTQRPDEGAKRPGEGRDPLPELFPSRQDPTSLPSSRARLVAVVYTPEAAREAASSGATEVVFDPFLRHPVPPAARIATLAESLRAEDVQLRLRLPTIVRPEERRSLDKWLGLDLPLQTGHIGLAVELARAGRDVVADYAVNCTNAHTAQLLFDSGIQRIVASVELTVAELAELVGPWKGQGFDVVLYGRPEGMTIEHCVLSAAFDRVATTCRDLCVVKHPVVELTDPAGYTFPVATDSACRNRLLHSRPIEGSEFVPDLTRAGICGFQLLYNVPTDPVGPMVRGYAALLGTLENAGPTPRQLTGGTFTRGHFARAV